MVNAIELFEQGYFDCAYYSLLSTVDISTTMLFLLTCLMRIKKLLNAWMEPKDFPTQGQKVRLLASKGNIFVDMKEKMPKFFFDAKELSK